MSSILLTANITVEQESGAEPDIFIWGATGGTSFATRGAVNGLCRTFRKRPTERDLIFGGPLGGQAKFWGGSGPPWHPPSSAPGKKASWPPLQLRFLYLHASDIHHNTRSIEAEQQACSKTPTPEISLQNLRAYNMWILSNSWATGWRMQLLNVKAVESLNVFENCLDFISLNAMKCDCGNIFVRYLLQTCLPKTISLWVSYLELIKSTNMI